MKEKSNKKSRVFTRLVTIAAVYPLPRWPREIAAIEKEIKEVYPKEYSIFEKAMKRWEVKESAYNESFPAFGLMLDTGVVAFRKN